MPRPLSPAGRRVTDWERCRRRALAAAPAGGKAARGRGMLVHALLQCLPACTGGAEARAALGYARRVLPEAAEQVAAQVLAVLTRAGAGAAIRPGSRAEQALTGVVNGQVITGRVDRLAMLPDAVLVADYKTGRTPPASAEGDPCCICGRWPPIAPCWPALSGAEGALHADLDRGPALHADPGCACWTGMRRARQLDCPLDRGGSGAISASKSFSPKE